MSVFGPVHPLDVDLADLADGVLDAGQTALVEAHLAGCLVCRARMGRLRQAPPATLHLDRPLPTPDFEVPGGPGRGGDGGGGAPGGGGGAVPAIGDLWLVGDNDRMLVLVLRVRGDRVLVAPVTFDIEAADDETLVVEDAGLAVHAGLATEVSGSVLVERVGRSELPTVDARRGAAIADATDPRAGVRQDLADRLGSIADSAPDPQPAGPGLIDDLRALRGPMCAVRTLDDWGDAALPGLAGWEPVATLDEVGIVLVVLDTPHGLADDADFHVARSVLTRFNATALVVLAGAVSDTAEVFDSSSLNHGIDAPSGRHTAPRPLISGLSPFDAIAKFLDQSSGARMAAPSSRGPVTRVDVDDILREAAAAAIDDAVRQGSRFKIAPKRRGYESVADAQDGFAAALARAFGPEPSVVQELLDL